jgi:acetoin utilization deacetylase AcuC-like enzyme
LRLFYCDHHEFPLPPGHRFPSGKYRLVRERLAADPRVTVEPAPLALVEEICRAHDRDYVTAFLEGAIDPAAMRRIGFPWSEALVNRTLASVGGTLAAARVAMESRCSGNLAGGTHHAFRDYGSGFCVFNDLAIAILALRSSGLAERAAVVDLDVHQGDGTAHMFSGDDRVLTLSMHGRNNFPFRKQQSRIDVELPDGTGDEEYLRELASVLPRVFDWWPEVIFYQSGVDGLATDRLGRLALTLSGLMERDRQVFESARGAGIPVVITMGGGYSEPIECTAEAHTNTYLQALQYIF